MSSGPAQKTVAAILYWADHFVKGDYGYSQAARWTGRKSQPGDLDCTSLIGVILLRAGYLDVSDLTGLWYSGDGSTSSPIPRKLKAKGWRLVSAKGKSLAWLRSHVTEGSVLIGPGHGVMGLGAGEIISWEYSERSGIKGKIGRQKGERVGRRRLYLRSRGWITLCLPPSDPKPTKKPKYRWPTLKRGSKGKLVKLWQRFAKLRHPVMARKAARQHGARTFKADGIYGPITETLDQMIQRKYRRKQTGKVKHWEWRHLGLSRRVRKAI